MRVRVGRSRRGIIDEVEPHRGWQCVCFTYHFVDRALSIAPDAVAQLCSRADANAGELLIPNYFNCIINYGRK